MADVPVHHPVDAGPVELPAVELPVQAPIPANLADPLQINVAQTLEVVELSKYLLPPRPGVGCPYTKNYVFNSVWSWFLGFLLTWRRLEVCLSCQ